MGAEVAGDVGQGLAEKVRRGLHRCRGRPSTCKSVGRHRGSVGEFVYCGGETVVGEDLGVDAAHGGTQILQGVIGQSVGSGYQVERRSVGQFRLGLPQRHGQGDEALLGAVVKVTLDTASFDLEGVDQSGTRTAQLGHGSDQPRLRWVEQ